RRRLAQEANQHITADDVTAIDAERLTESCHEQISGARIGNLFRPAAPWPEGTDTVRVVNNEKSILRKRSIELVDERANALQRCMDASHTEHAVCHDDCSRASACRLGQVPFELIHVEMTIDALFGRPTQRDRVDD